MSIPDISMLTTKLTSVGMVAVGLRQICFRLEAFPELEDEVAVLAMIERGMQAMYARTLAAIEQAADGRS